jgi:hypothetical protein
MDDLREMLLNELNGPDGEALAEILELETPESDLLDGTPYIVEDGCICWRKHTKEGPVTVPLCNFTARVIRDVLKDDGLEPVRVFEITGRLASGKALPVLAVPAERFFSMSWVAQWGVDAVISAGMGAKDRLREAIQLASKGARQERVYTHIGWRNLDGRWCYLHAGGAVGASGVLVEPENGNLQCYVLPHNGSTEEGLKASLRLLEVAPFEVPLPLWAAIWRAPTACLLYPTLVLWLFGETGSYKSTLAALFLCHYGGPFTKDSLPASWLSTDNALERQAFLCRDAVLVVDDYAPEKNPREAAILDKRVNRFVRQIGNRAARDRMTADLRLRESFPPNALVISTGEQLPLGVSSVAARILPVYCDREKVDLQKLTEAQAKAHLLPQAMRGYLEWLAPQMDVLRRELPRRFQELRAKATVDGHARLPEAVAHLQLGAELGLRFAVESGVLGEKEAQEWENLFWMTLLDSAREHVKTLEEEKPAVKFLQTLDAIFQSGYGHLVHRMDGQKGEYGTSGDKLGWYDDDGLYFIPEAAWRATQEYLRPSGGFPVRERTLRDMLAREGVLVKDEGGRTTRSLRMEGTKRRVIHLDKNLYLSYLTKAVPPVPGAANLTAATDSAEHVSGSTREKAVPETVPPLEGGTALEPDGTGAEPVTCSTGASEPSGFERGGTAGTGSVGRETYKEKLFGTEGEGDTADEFDGIPF